MLKKSFFILLITFALGNFSFADQKDKWSISIGQFDVCLLYTSPSPRDRG